MFFIFLALAHIDALAQCNGHLELCDKRYDEVAYITTHNAYNSEEAGLLFPNHTFDIAHQLEDGVRALMLDVYDEGGVATQYHGFSALGTVPLADDLQVIKTFLDTHPNEVVTIIFECYISALMMEEVFTDVGLIPYLHEQTAGEPWPTLQSMIDSDKRLVVLTDKDNAQVGQDWYHYVWDFAVETHFTNNSPSDFDCDFNRGDPENDLFILNHFVTDANIGVGLPDQAEIVNEFSYFYDRAELCQAETGKFPNFLTIDFHELGNVFLVADSINGVAAPLSVQDNSQSLGMSITAQLGQSTYQIRTDRDVERPSVRITSAFGQVVAHQKVSATNTFTIDLSPFMKGIYFVTLTDARGGTSTIKLVR